MAAWPSRQGHLRESLKFFARAIEHFRMRNPQHRNLARTLTNIAYVQRLVAVQLGRANRRGKTTPPDSKRRAPVVASRPSYTSVRSWASAFANLDQAENIYRLHQHHHGIGSIMENRGLLSFDIGDLDNASAHAEQAYELGKQENDSILMARARLLQCEAEMGKLEGDRGKHYSWAHAQAARDYAREAVERPAIPRTIDSSRAPTSGVDLPPATRPSTIRKRQALL